MYWHIMHNPPSWATHYQWVYSGNTSVGEFVQIILSRRFKDMDGNIYLGLRSMKSTYEESQHNSYSDNEGSIIDFEATKGDRIRFISFISPGRFFDNNGDLIPNDEDDQAASNLEPDGTVNSNPYTHDATGTYGGSLGLRKGQDERDRRYFKKYYDFEIAEYLANPTITILKNENEGDDASEKTTTLAGWYVK